MYNCTLLARCLVFPNELEFAAGAILNQFVDGALQILGFFSSRYTSAERRYGSYDSEQPLT